MPQFKPICRSVSSIVFMMDFARLGLTNAHYFTLQISMRRQEMIIDLILAVTAIGLVGLNAFSAPVLVTLLGLEIAVLAAAKPILNYSQRLMHATSLATRYGRIRQQFQELVADVNATHEMLESNGGLSRRLRRDKLDRSARKRCA